MLEIVNSAVIGAPAERIFDFIAQAERNVEWVPDLKSSRRLTPGPTRTGTRFEFVVKLSLISLRMVDKVVACERPQLIQFTGIEGVEHAGSWRMEPLPSQTGGTPQTRVIYRMSFELPAAVGPLVSRMINLPERLERQSQTCLDNLRRILEH